jgi:hypothetical protein
MYCVVDDGTMERTGEKDMRRPWWFCRAYYDVRGAIESRDEEGMISDSSHFNPPSQTPEPVPGGGPPGGLLATYIW